MMNTTTESTSTNLPATSLLALHEKAIRVIKQQWHGADRELEKDLLAWVEPCSGFYEKEIVHHRELFTEETYPSYKRLAFMIAPYLTESTRQRLWAFIERLDPRPAYQGRNFWKPEDDEFVDGLVFHVDAELRQAALREAAMTGERPRIANERSTLGKAHGAATTPTNPSLVHSMNAAANILGVSRSTLKGWQCHVQVRGGYIFDCGTLALHCSRDKVAKLQDESRRVNRGRKPQTPS